MDLMIEYGSRILYKEKVKWNIKGRTWVGSLICGI